MHFPVALKYVSVEEFYPADWAHHTIGEVIESKATIQETWGAMESLIDLGLTKTIGVSNFAAALLIDLFRYARIPPATLQIEHHPYLVQPELVSFAKARGMAVTAYSSFGPQSFLELNYESAISALPLFDNPTILELSKKYEKSPAQVLLRWSTQRGLAVIPKSNSPHRLLENLHCTGFNMEESDIKKISALDKGLRFNDPRDITDHLPIFV
jgi:D-xylose reductase